MLDNFACFLLSAIFSQINFFHEYHKSAKQFWIHIGPNKTSGLIWVQKVCKSHHRRQKAKWCICIILSNQRPGDAITSHRRWSDNDGYNIPYLRYVLTSWIICDIKYCVRSLVIDKKTINASSTSLWDFEDQDQHAGQCIYFMLAALTSTWVLFTAMLASSLCNRASYFGFAEVNFSR